MNLPTLLTGLAVLAAFCAIVGRGIDNRRRGKGGCSCGGDCGSCGGCGAVASQDQKSKRKRTAAPGSPAESQDAAARKQL